MLMSIKIIKFLVSLILCNITTLFLLWLHFKTEKDFGAQFAELDINLFDMNLIEILNTKICFN